MKSNREKLVELLCKTISTTITVGEQADFLIANGVTLNQWIPVTERLPEDSGKYLAVVPTNVLSADRIVLSLWYSQCLGFYDTDAMMGYIRIRDVTHWMPLPEPPKEE